MTMTETVTGDRTLSMTLILPDQIPFSTSLRSFQSSPDRDTDHDHAHDEDHAHDCGRAHDTDRENDRNRAFSNPILNIAAVIS